MALVLTFVLILFGFLNFIGVPFSPIAIMGHVVNDSGIVQIFVEKVLILNIHSPENITYYFDKGDPYIIALNVSANFNVDEWRYSLYDVRHGVNVEVNTLFVPNSSISAVRWENVLTVFAHEVDGDWTEGSVQFFVSVPNSAPLLGNISDPILVCEGQRLSYRTNATDIDEDTLNGDISPKNPFYLAFRGRVGIISYFDIISGGLGKNDIGDYVESVSVVDPSNEIDSQEITIKVIEINNLPQMENIGAQTVWLKGEDSVFFKEVSVWDVEDGGTSDGNLEFNLSWGGNEDLFDIGVVSGVMNYTPTVGHEGRVYSLTVCVEDNALGSVHENISVCSPFGGDAEVVCDDFTLTVTDENRAPVIVNYTPVSDMFSLGGTSQASFFVEVYDADGTIPDIDWYVDGVEREHNENVSNDSFVYSFGCENGGAHRIEIVTTDGLLNASQRWDILVSEVECPELSSGGGGGGGGGGDYCIEDWLCDDWKVCQNVKRSFDARILSREDYALARDVCSQNGEEDERYCGFQITSCYDLNVCNRSKSILERPTERRFCYFTENPGCFDGITNCHSGGCELLVDCGGPCAPCATCSDGKQNQGEAGVDCGGPCPYTCEPEAPFAMLSSVLIVLAILLMIVILYVLRRLFLLWKRWDKDDEETPLRDRDERDKRI